MSVWLGSPSGTLPAAPFGGPGLNLAAEGGPWVLGDRGVPVVLAGLLLAGAALCLLSAVRGRDLGGGQRAALVGGAVAAVLLAEELIRQWGQVWVIEGLAQALPFALAVGAVGWALRLARPGPGGGEPRE